MHTFSRAEKALIQNDRADVAVMIVEWFFIVDCFWINLSPSEAVSICGSLPVCPFS